MSAEVLYRGHGTSAGLVINRLLIQI